MRCYNDYRQRCAAFAFWRLSTGTEVDFIVNDMACAIECKAARAVHDGHLKGLRELTKDHPEVDKRVVVCLDENSRRTADGIAVLSVEDFLRSLWAGELF